MNKIVKVMSGTAFAGMLAFSSLTPTFAAEGQAVNTSQAVTQKEAAGCITQTKAKEVALKQVSGAYKSAELVKESSTYIYKVIVVGEDGNEHQVKLNAKTGKVINSSVQTKASFISKQNAKSVALKQVKGTFKTAELKQENGVFVYNVIILDQNGKQQQVKINADTGKVTKTETVTQTTTQTTTTSTKTVSQVKITAAKAQTAALKEVNGAVKTAKLTKENGVNLYHVNVIGEDGKEHQVKVNASSGKIVKTTSSSQVTYLTKAKAKTAALKYQTGTVKSVTMKVENGTCIYQVSIKDNSGKTQQVNINAQTGVKC